MAEEKQVGITVSKDKDFSEWYTQVVQKADLADYSPVKGCMIIKPHGYSIWEQIQHYFNERLRMLNVKNAYFPLFIPESFFKKEMAHAQGFTPEVAWIANKEDERLAVRPTSETVMYDAYAKWIRSHRDLPLRINQWNNVVRWESKQTRLFLRTREFLWQEGHCAYATEEECRKETERYLDEYKRLCEEVLAIAVLFGRKSESERFAGAVDTYSIDAIMPDGRSLQMGTSHHLGQGFAKAFGISFLGEDGKKHIPWQNSWGFSTRLIGAVVMVHGDDKGLVLPPRVASQKAVIIPIYKEHEKEAVLKEARKIEKTLSAYHVFVDDRDGYTPGWKFNEWELKGIPLRIEIGPKDIAKKQVILVRRDTSKKIPVALSDLGRTVAKQLEAMHKDMLDRSRKLLTSSIKSVNNWKGLVDAIEQRFVVQTIWCGKRNCEERVKNEANGARTINLPLVQKGSGNCVACGQRGTMTIYFGKVY